MIIKILAYIVISFILGIILVLFKYKGYKKIYIDATAYSFYIKKFDDSSVLLLFYMLLSPIFICLELFLVICIGIRNVVLYVIDRAFDMTKIIESKIKGLFN